MHPRLLATAWTFLLKKTAHFARNLLITGVVLSLLIALANWHQRGQEVQATDGVLWSESGVGLIATDVRPDSAGSTAGLRPGDVLLGVDAGSPAKLITNLQEYSDQLESVRPGSDLFYSIAREGTPLRLRLTLREESNGSFLAVVLAAVGLFYLLLGAWVLWRRLDNSRSVIFVLYCISSFVMFAFSYSGRFDALDWTVYWFDVAAMLLQPALFVHLCLTYWQAARGDTARVESGFRSIRFGVYATAALLAIIHVGFAVGVLRSPAFSLGDSRWWIDRFEIGFLASMYMLGTALLAVALRATPSRLVWKQLVWVLGGALIAFAPFTIAYAIPYLAGTVPATWMSLSAVSLITLPSAMAYAMARHRLLDVDVAIGRGAAWTLATGVLVASYLGIAALAGEFLRRNIPEAGTLGWLLAVIATGLSLRPLQGWFQRFIDNSFLKHRYDYRESILRLGAQLGLHADREQIARSLLEPLINLLELERAAVLVPAETGDFRILLGCAVDEEFPPQVLSSDGISDAEEQSAGDFGFLRLLEGNVDGGHGRRTHDWLHFVGGDSRTIDNDHLLDRQLWEHEEWRKTLGAMRMPYYFPCRAKDRLVAVLGIGRTVGGELISERDEAFIATLCGYLALALESGELLESLTSKAQQYADLQQFSDNILESINVGVLAVTLDDRVEAINTPLELMVPIRFHESKGRALRDILPADLHSEYEQSKLDMGVHTIDRYRVAGENQADRILNIAIAPLLSRNCECIGRLMVFDDVTDRIALETQLAQADKLSSLGLLAAGVAHEVNTPLTVISTQAQMLEKMLAQRNLKNSATEQSSTEEINEKTSKTLERIISQTFRASEIVNSLLKFSRSSLSNGPRTATRSQPVESGFAPVELNQLISETILLVEHSLKVCQIQTETHLEPGLALMSGHVGKLQQVLLNLILNACDAMPRGGKLRLTTWTEGETVRVEIRDTGMGIPPESLSRIYDPFFTTKGPGKAPGRHQGTGTGLGLAVTYGIVQEHTGTISVESKPGFGTRFELQFPVLRKPVHA
jgi:two-component system, NtrC family, sensor kinase